MSGLLSSLLIDPVVRQTRRFSNARPSSIVSHQASPDHTQHEISPQSTFEDYGREFTMSDQSQEHPGRRPNEYAGPGNDPAISPSSISGSRANRDGQGIHPTSSERSENGSEFSEVLGYHGASTTGRRTDAPPAPTGTASRNRRERGRLPGNGFGMDGIGGHFSLPEDDGMGVLRRKIHAIRDMRSTNTEKARMVHELMTEKYNASRADSGNDPVPMVLSRLSPQSPERPAIPVSYGDGQTFDKLPAAAASTTDRNQQDNPFNLSEEALQPTFFPKTESDSPVLDDEEEEEDMDTEELEEAILGCQHYKRNVKLQCTTCKKWYTCRFCHDEVEDHHLIRHKTQNMLCMMCGHAQPAAHFCENCEGQAAQYFCEACKLWDNDNKKSIYHCTDCGICRIGQGLGKDFFHCKVSSGCFLGTKLR